MSIKALKNTTNLIIVGILLLGLITALFAVQKVQELRNKAAVPQGTASIELDPGEMEEGILKDTPVSLKINTRVATPTDGFQVVANFIGTVPPDLKFNPTILTGLELAYVNLSDTSTGKQLQAVYVSQNPLEPVGSPATPLGTISFTSPGSGTLTISFDPLKSIVAENQSSQDVLTAPASYHYNFITPLSSPSPSPSVKPSPSPSSKPSPSPTTRPRRSPRGIPIPSVKPPIQ